MDDFERLQKWGVILRSGGSGVDVYRKVLSDIFSKSRDEAESLMSEIFQVGYVYMHVGAYEIAEQKLYEATRYLEANKLILPMEVLNELDLETTL